MSTEICKATPERGVISYDYGDTAGAGFEAVTGNHVALPFLNLLQALSPEVAGTDSEIVDGAKPGMFLNSVTGELYDRLIFVPAYTRETWIQWQSREAGGGKVAEYPPEHSCIVAAREVADQWNRLKIGDDSLIQTFLLLGLVVSDSDAPTPAVLSLSSTKIKPYKAFMTRLSLFRLNGQQPPLSAHTIRISSAKETNRNNQPYFNVRFEAACENNIARSLLPPGNETSRMADQLRQSYLGSSVRVSEQTSDLPF